MFGPLREKVLAAVEALEGMLMVRFLSLSCLCPFPNYFCENVTHWKGSFLIEGIGVWIWSSVANILVRWKVDFGGR